ncbi:hypothetical protein ABPG74_004003 [Tetrahymena malaccensis]
MSKKEKSGFLPLEEEKSMDKKSVSKSKDVTPRNVGQTPKSQGMFGGFKNSISSYIKKKIETKIMQFLRDQKPKVQDKIRDKAMPKCVQNFMDDIVEENWPILEEEVQYQLRIRTDVPFVEVKKPDVSCFCWPCWKIRSLFQYSLMPYDKSLGQKLRNPIFILGFLAMLCPIYGISSFYFILLFLIIDKSDEYQLINFILEFKRLQFFSIGVIGGTIGFYMYFKCVEENTHLSLSIQQNCYQYGPSMLIHPRIDLIAFGINILLVWITLIFLPFSEQKGKLRFKNAEIEEQKETERKEKERQKRLKKREKLQKKIETELEKLEKEGKVAKFEDLAEKYKMKQFDDLDEEAKKQQGCCSFQRGGGMKCLIIWDILAFGLAFLFFYNGFRLENKQSFEDAKGHIYFTKWIYAMLSFPFLLFSVPLVSSLLSRARPTAYDMYGNTVPIIGQVEYDDDLMDDIDDDLEDEGVLNDNNDTQPGTSTNRNN